MTRTHRCSLATLFACTLGCIFDPPPDAPLDSGGQSETSSDAETSSNDRPADSSGPSTDDQSTDGGHDDDTTPDGGLGTTDGRDTHDPETSDTDDSRPATIYEIQLGVYALGDPVHVEGVVVTALAHNGLWVQEPRGGEYSGCFVFVGDAYPHTVTVGDEVDVAGSYQEFFDNTQINATRGSVDATGSSGLHIEPVVAPLATAAGEAWEGVLVRVQQPLVVVTQHPWGMVIGGVEQGVTANVSSQLFDPTSVPRVFPQLGVGASLSSIAGVVTQSFDAHRLVPRDAADFTGYSPPVPVARPLP